jgi:hypothetical protein
MKAHEAARTFAAGHGLPPEALLAGYPEPMIEIAERLRAIVRQAVPGVVEAVRPGWRLIGYDLSIGRKPSFFAWISPEPGHVHLGFPQGILLLDPGALLSGPGITKRARWFTFVPGDPIPTALFAGFVREAARIAGLSRSEREAIMLAGEARRAPR